jgi:O-antigen/teichoic acid export membrane protein
MSNPASSPPEGHERHAAAHHATRHLLGRGSLYAIAQAIQLGSALLVVPIVTRLLDADEYGQVATGLVATRVLAMVVGLGLPSAVTLEHFRGERGEDRARWLVIATVAASVVLTLAASVGLVVWQSAADGEAHVALQLAVWATAPLATVIACQALLQAQDRVRSFVLLTAVSTLGGQLLGLTFTVVFTRSAASYLAGLLIGYSAAAVLGLVVTVRGHGTSFERSTLRRGLAVGLPTVPHSVSLYVLALGDRLVIQQVSGFAEVGRYDVAYQVGSLSIVALVAYNQAWAPIIYGADDRDRWSVLAITTGWVVRLSSLLAVIIAVAAPIVLLLAAPSSYDPTGLTVATGLTAAAVVPYALYLSRAHVIFQQRATHVLAWATPLAAAIGIGTCALLVRPFGLSGAAASTIIGYAVQAALIGWAASRLARVAWLDRTTVLAVLGCIAGVVVAVAVPHDGVWLVVRAFIAVGIGLGLLATARRAVTASLSPAV